jgi:hypothetical protein
MRVTGSSSGQAERFSHPVTAYNPECISLCSVNIRNSRTQINIVGEICCGLEQLFIKEKM